MRHLLLRGTLPSGLALATKAAFLHTWQVLHPSLVSRTRFPRPFICQQTHSAGAQAVDWEKLDNYRVQLLRNWLTPGKADLPLPVVIAWLFLLNIPGALVMYLLVTH